MLKQAQGPKKRAINLNLKWPFGIISECYSNRGTQLQA